MLEELTIILHDHVPPPEDIGQLREGGVTAKFYNISVDCEVGRNYLSSRERFTSWRERAGGELRRVQRVCEEQSDTLLLARSVNDFLHAQETGRVALIIASEGAKILEGEIDALAEFYELGLQHLQLTWGSFPNHFANADSLTDFGRQALRGMNELGIIVDVTHLFERAFWQVVDEAQGPIVVSHDSAAGAGRGLTDERIRAVADTGGVIGIHFYITYLAPALPDGQLDSSFGVEQVVEHVRYIADLVGVEYVALGCDFFPTHGAWRQFQEAQGVGTPKWAIDGPHELPLVRSALLEAGFSLSEVSMIFGGNVLRVCRQVWGE